ncbi:hypothetical protein F7725_016280 [Dissostichus mawsoni]|uniref:Uncharacterized protein n=1 Tax=Dissostichus mawsoni TaxID=36200 RepID=A0A7J5Z433_DISMA|nr:hypothetical protein F7725_016280 [Dissostichus mawsoni]
MRKLLDRDNNFLFPVVFVTNAGSCQRHDKAQQLSRLLEVQVSPEQVVLSHSPLQTLDDFHDKCVLVSGQGPVTEIAKTLGFQKVLSVDQLRVQHPLLDMVDHNRRPDLSMGANLQLLIDVLLTNGSPGRAYEVPPPAQLPVLACNVDLTWMAEAPSPRFGHGVFLLCMESVYRKLTGLRGATGKTNLLTYQYAEKLLRLQNHNHKISTIYAIG